MSGLALALVLTGALCHAIWNIVAKKAAGGLPFVWLFGQVSVIAALPVAAWMWHTQPQTFDASMWIAAIGSGVIHIVYSLVLQKGYQVSDFSVVYPIARGSGPMLTVLVAIALLGELPSLTGALSVTAILLGLFVSADGGRIFRGGNVPQKKRQLGVLWGLLTGLCIASYTVLDGWAIKALGMSPVLFYVVGLIVRSALLAPFALRRPDELRAQWRAHRGAILTVGLLSPAAYSLVLYALQIAPLSYVAPVREISMLIGTLLGARLLKEAVRPTQIAGAAIMLAGVTGLAFA